MLLTALGNSKDNIYFQKTGKGSTPSVVYSSHSFKHDPKDILFLHAISGCDTTSAPFGNGKKKVLQVYKANPKLTEILAVFKNPEANSNQIMEAGEKFLAKLYGGTNAVNLDDLRYKSFSSTVGKPKCQLARLPPTRDAAKYHSFRTYLQVQVWMGSDAKLPSDWGWKQTQQG